MLATRFTSLVGCRLPLQQAGMGTVAMAPLVLAVAEAGGLGMLGGVMLPPQVLAGMLDDLAARTRGAFGVNFLIPFLDRDAVPVAATRARVVEFFYGEPEAALVDAVHTGGALACWQVGSLGEAIAAARAGCDLIVAQGTEAGGHVRGRVGLLPLLNAVPMLGNQMVQIIKDSAFLVIIAVQELTFAANEIQANYYVRFASFICAVLLYWGLCLGVEGGVRIVERAAEARR